MVLPPLAELSDSPRGYQSSRALFDVVEGEDAARPLIEACSSGNDKALQNLLSQPQWLKIMLEKSYAIFSEDRPSEGPDDIRPVTAMVLSNVERALTVAGMDGQAAVVPVLLTFATQQDMDLSKIITRPVISKAIWRGHAAFLKAVGSSYPDIIKVSLGHGTLPFYEAVRLRQPDVATVFLELGADPFHPVEPSKELRGFRSSLLSHAVLCGDLRMLKILLEQGLPIAGSAALHTAAACDYFDTMEFLVQQGADVNEFLVDMWSGWSPIFFAAWRGRVDAMKWLEDRGARSDLEDEEGKTPAQVLEEHYKPKD